MRIKNILKPNVNNFNSYYRDFLTLFINYPNTTENIEFDKVDENSDWIPVVISSNNLDQLQGSNFYTLSFKSLEKANVPLRSLIVKVPFICDVSGCKPYLWP